jgi:8-oxo-dGTP pyrophosphatase MutT (NUDIX family)
MTGGETTAQAQSSGNRQVAALCWRRADRLEVLLVTSLHTRRWILPKGWPVAGISPARAAAREALEEAGVTGEISENSVGMYRYVKVRKSGEQTPLTVDVFALRVTLEHQAWPEKGVREVMWLTPEAAAAKVQEPELQTLLANFYDPVIR